MSQNNWSGQDQTGSDQQGNYNDPQQGGYSQRRNPNQQGYNDPNQQGYNDPNQQGYNDPNQQGYNDPNQQGYNDPNQQGSSSQNSFQDGSSPRNDGYADTQGSDSAANRYGQPASDTPVQQSSDPNRSGVQPAQNQPGRRVDSPGRDTGTSWGEDEQMGYTTDTPDRKNPAN